MEWGGLDGWAQSLERERIDSITFQFLLRVVILMVRICEAYETCIVFSSWSQDVLLGKK